jgi:uncharacterized protein (TIGR03435 family)
MKRASAICSVLPALCLTYSIASQAQPPAAAPERPAFEVASIKVHRPTPGPFRSSREMGPAGISFTNADLNGCIRSAYGVAGYQIVGGQDGLPPDRYDILAKAAGAVPKAQLMLMLQMLLEDRFKLKVHREIKELPVYGLVVGKKGLRVHAGKEGGETEIGGASHFINSRGMTMKDLAGVLSQITQTSGRPVLDMTGLSGVFDITLDFIADDSVPGDSNSGADMFSALKEIGLKLEPRKSPIEVVIVDHAEKPSEN